MARSNSQAVEPAQQTAKVPILYQRFGERYGVAPAAVGNILKATAFKTKDAVPSDAQMCALLILADQFKLNPFTKEIFAFPDKQNGIVPVVGVDGWNRIAKSHPDYSHERYEVPPRDEWVKFDEDAQLCPEEFTVVIVKKDGTEMAPVTEYLDEVYRPAFVLNNGHKLKGPWQTHTKRMLRHKARIQAFREHFGFSGIYDEDEAQRIVDSQTYDIEVPAVEVVGVDGWAALRELADNLGYDHAERLLLANAETLGYVGEGVNMPVTIAQQLSAAMRESARQNEEEPDPQPEPQRRRGRPPKVKPEQLTRLKAAWDEVLAVGGRPMDDFAQVAGDRAELSELTAEEADGLLQRWETQVTGGDAGQQELS